MFNLPIYWLIKYEKNKWVVIKMNDYFNKENGKHEDVNSGGRFWAINWVILGDMVGLYYLAN